MPKVCTCTSLSKLISKAWAMIVVTFCVVSWCVHILKCIYIIDCIFSIVTWAEWEMRILKGSLVLKWYLSHDIISYLYSQQRCHFWTNCELVMTSIKWCVTDGLNIHLFLQISLQCNFKSMLLHLCSLTLLQNSCFDCTHVGPVPCPKKDWDISAALLKMLYNLFHLFIL